MGLFFEMIKTAKGNGNLIAHNKTILPLKGKKMAIEALKIHASVSNMCLSELFYALAIFCLFKESTLLYINHSIRPKGCQLKKYLQGAANNLRD